MGYSIHAVEAKGDFLFKLDVSGDMLFEVYSKKQKPDILVMETIVHAKPHVTKALSRLPKTTLRRFLNELSLELLRLGLETGMITKPDGSETMTWLRHQMPMESDKRAVFVKELLQFKSGKDAINIYYENLANGLYK